MSHTAATPGPGLHLNPIGEVVQGMAPYRPTGGEDADEQLQRKAHDMARASRLRLYPLYEPLLEGIEGFSHLLVIFWAHRLEPAERAQRRIHPMRRGDLPLVGVFATCSPTRPNPILVTAVELLERSGPELIVTGLDAQEGSPLLDLKPCALDLPPADQRREPDWWRQLRREIDQAAARVEAADRD